jgi:superfamily I DNA/RNA helicase/mRNA-degrading endonuclease RelE of RelBE toxin-antitoxin system
MHGEPYQGERRGQSVTEVLISEEFSEELATYDTPLRTQVMEKVRLLQQNPAHPSLNVHKVRNTDDKWEFYVTMNYRVIYDQSGGTLRLWKLGPHVIVDRVRYTSFAAHTAFHHPTWLEAGEEGTSEPEARVLSSTPAYVRPVRGPFADFPPTHLRILGVPAHRVKEIRSAPDFETIERLPDLPPQTVRWLMELLSDPALETVVFDPGRLLYRATLDQLEGYCGGSIRQLMLNLTPDQQQYVDQARPGITVLKGVAGSGKTTVGVYRAINRAMEGRRVALLTYNRTLAAVTRSLVESLIGPLPDNLTVTNIDRWIAGLLEERGVAVPKVLSDAECLPLLEQALAEVRQTGTEAVLEQRATFFRDEVARVIKGAGLREERQYLQVERHGRKSALGPDQRRAVWRVYEAYQRKLAEAGACDWRDPALLAYEELSLRPLAEPYDDVVIDEGQDLTPVQLRIAQRLVRGGGGDPSARSFLLLGDAAQTIYSRGFAWRQAGIAAQGRTFTLRRNHRNTRQIAEAAAELLAHNELLKAGPDFVAPEWTERNGARPIILECDTADRELRAVRERLLDLVGDQRFRVSDFAVICPTGDLCEKVRNDLLAAGLPSAFHRDEEFDVLEEQVKVLTIHSAKGLEFPVVFLVGLREGILPHRPPLRLESEERTLELERQRTLLYVGITRAAEALYLVTTSGARSDFLKELGNTVLTEAVTRG